MMTLQPVPQRIQIEPTNRCNFHCGYCRRTHWSRPTGDMSFERFSMLIDSLPTVPRIHLQGVGEPLLHKDFPRMVRLLKGRGFSVGTSTNASLLTRKMSASLLDTGIDRINLSVDTLDAQEFARVRPGAPLKKVLANIATLADVRKQGGYVGCELAIAVVAEQSTIRALADIVERAAQWGLDEVYVQNLNDSFLPADYVAAQKCSHAGLDDYRTAMLMAEEVATMHAIRFLAPPLGHPDLTKRCGWPEQGCNITWDGFVSPCCLQPDPDVLNFGNVFETDFAAIWNGTAYRQFREDARLGRASVCQSCPDLHGQMWHPQATPIRPLPVTVLARTTDA